MNLSAAELELQIDQSRDVLLRDVDALRRKAAPREMMREAVQRATEQGRRTGADLVARARAHPGSVAALAGVLFGVMWLRRRRRR
jgi:hypothetical protein